MQLTPELEAELRLALDTYWNSYLEGDIETWASYLADEYHNIGTTQEEVWQSKQEIVDYSRTVIEQLQGGAEVRNKTFQFMPIDPYVMVHELGEMFLRVDGEWRFYAHIRLTSLMEKRKDGWKILHQHGSYPDANASQGDVLGFDKIKSENNELREAVRRRTIDLEIKNRELEIESALEKVRTVAMGMQSPEDMLQICQIIAEQLSELGLKEVRNVQTAIFYPERGTFMNYEYYARHKKKVVTEVNYQAERSLHEWARKMMQGPGTEYYEQLKGKELLDWYAYSQTSNMFVDEHILQAKSLNYYSHALGPIALILSTYDTLEREELSLFKRFLKVFELSYKRYLDLEKAFHQAREAQIEAAMEKVRGRSLAMQEPGEIREIAEMLRREMAQLGVEALETSSIYIREPEKDTIECWYAIKDVRGEDSELVSDEMTLNLNDTWVGKEMQAFLASGEEQVSIRMQGEHRKEWIKYCAQRSEALQDYYGTEIPERTYHLVKFANGFMGAASPGEISAESWRLLKRSAAVFSFAYTRFLDLRQSAQNAREAQIELGLERVRAKTMAMYKSTQLSETARVLFEQFAELGRIPDRMSIGIVKDEMGFIEWWATDQTGSQLTNHFDSSIEQPTVARIFSGWKEGRESMVIEVTGEELKAWVAFVRDKVQMPMDDSKIKGKRVHHAAYFSQGILLISAHEQVPDETMKILARFAKVFEQAYTRFLDLQKAEAQAREAQIEAALERVRSKTMAMQTSNALNEVIAILYKELSKLHPQLDRCFIMTFDLKTLDAVWWMASGELENYQTGLSVPYASFKPQQAYINAWKERVERWTYALEGEDKLTWDGYLFYHTDLQHLPEVVKRSMQDAPKAFISASFRNFGCITTGSFEPLNEQAFTLLTRFGVVFEQAYTRFVDLKQAEAQAREAKIEVALERVRAKAMAMHSSEDLIEVVGELRRQMGMLGQKDLETCVIHLHDESPDFIYSYAAIRPPGSSDEILETTTLVPKKGFLIIEEALEAYHQHRQDYIIMNEGEKLKQWFAFLEKESPDGFKKLVEPVHGSIEELRGYWSLSDFSGGSLVMVTMDRPDDHTRGLLRRFSNVFGLAYRRYADLKKAEAQAREAQVEAALERVRAKAMAMHSSKDLPATAITAFTELNKLGFVPIRSGISIQTRDSRKNLLYSATNVGDGETLSIVGWAILDNHPVLRLVYDNWLEGKDSFPELHGEQLRLYYEQVRSSFEVPIEQTVIDQHGYFICFTHGLFYGWCRQPVTEHEKILLRRFAAVIDLTFKRYFDLQKAEAQAREAQIETALERVRSRGLGMQKSEELKDVIQVVYEQLIHLNIKTEHAGFIMDYKSRDDFNTWIADHLGSPSNVSIPYFDCIYYNRFNEAKTNREEFFTLTLNKEEKNVFYEGLFQLLPDFPEASKQIIFNHPGFSISTVLMENVALYVENFTGDPYDDESNAVLMRFGKVFQQTYTRFLDLQRAEAQAREAQIEAALEKIRSRSLAMHSSQELIEVIAVVFEKMNELKILMGTVAIWLFDMESLSSTFWLGNEVQKEPSKVLLPYDEAMMNKEGCLKDAWDARRKNENIINKRYDKRLKDEYFDYVFANNDYHTIPEVARQFIRESSSQTISLFIEKNSTLFVDNWTDQSYSEAQLEIFKRVARVFEQAYVRFLDLQKAEAQARESNIEAALERVRSKAMAMRTSEDIAETTAASFEELRKLGVFSFRSGVGILSKESRIAQVFADSRSGENSTVALTTVRSMDEHPALQRQYASWLEQKDFEQVLRGDELTSYYSHSFFKGSSVEQTGTGDQQEEYGYYFAFPDGLFYSWSLQPYTEQEKNILHRFRNIIALTFRRYLDLQKAEAQTREAEIELALERVRARTMAMQKSDELPDAANLLFQQIQSLGMPAWSAGYCLFNEDRSAVTLWMSSEGLLQPPFVAPTTEDELFIQMRKGVEQGTDLHVVEMGGKDLEKHYRYMRSLPVVGEILDSIVEAGHPLPTFQIMHQAYFSKGFLLFITYESVPVAHEIFKRFAKVFDQTYTRFLDLQKAEIQALEATKQASLDRVRGVISSMRSAEDLNLITPLIFKELKILGVPFIRCGVFIIHEQKQNIEAYLSAPDGHSLGVLNLPFEASELTFKTVQAWRKNDLLKQHWNKEDFVAWTNQMVAQHQIEDSRSYQGSDLPPESLELHFVPFAQGMLYVGTTEPLEEAKLELVQSLARTFSIAYARYEDFVKLENAKEEIESALAELKATQKQLIQSEKMASLGELTAGIAHEIQNPLNFVNNFSEVSKELIDEVKESLAKGDVEDAMAIISDLVKNLERINEHGKRADSIVKGMLQHSRAGSGHKEPTDINVLADECLRLAFHGLRAKDKSFNANFETIFDPTIGKIDVMSQDMGRVLLNLINNAFYAVNERSKRGEAGYKPMVKVSTEKRAQGIGIRVEDNGDGIPDSIKEKIFQPFFTTKPTGQGTGLGLSLAYDIVKAHEGELTVVSEEGEGTAFNIFLPNL